MRKLLEVPAEVKANWANITNHAAQSALAEMATMGLITEPYHLDRSGHGVVGSFLQNSHGWHGPVARRVKAELRAMCK
jgi:hypothetical protein